MSDILYCEWLKLKRSKMVVIGILGSFIVPILVLFSSLQRYFQGSNYLIDLFELYDNALMFTMLLFAPLVTSVFATYLICREYSEKTLKTIFAVPISRGKFLQGKFLILFMIVMLFMLLSWLEILILAIVCNCFIEMGQITVMSAIFFLIKYMIGGVLVYMTITPVVYLCLKNKGFVTPFIVVAVICLLNVVLSGSPIAGIYPWSATYLLVSGHSNGSGCPATVSFLIIMFVCIISVVNSMKLFKKEDIV